MPGMGGQAMFEVLAERQPGLETKLLLTSTDTAGDTIEQVAERTGCPVLAKPFDVDGLHRAVQEKLAADS